MSCAVKSDQFACMSGKHRGKRRPLKSTDWKGHQLQDLLSRPFYLQIPIHLSLNFNTKFNAETTVIAQQTRNVFHYLTSFACGATAQLGHRSPHC